MASLLKADGGHESNIRPQHGAQFTAEELHAFVGGEYEFLQMPTLDRKIMVVPQAAVLTRIPNEQATDLAILIEMPFIDAIYGDVLICDRGEVNQDVQ